MFKKKKTFEIQNDISSEGENSSNTWILKSTPYIVCDIFLERYVTAGVLSKLFYHELPQKKKSKQGTLYFQQFFHFFCILSLVSTKTHQHQYFTHSTAVYYYLRLLEQL